MTLDAAIEAIIEGSRHYHLGVFLEHRRIQSDGLRQIDVGMTFVDEDCPEARDVLIPLLEHPNVNARVAVACALARSRPELAVPVLEDIAANCTTMARRTAATTLSFHNVFCPGLASLCRPDPRHPIPEEYSYKAPPRDP